MLSAEVLSRIQRHGEKAYPNEAAGFLLGLGDSRRVVMDIWSAENLGLVGARHNRYLIGPDEYLRAEREAERRKMDVLGVFHSHPDHPDEPSDIRPRVGPTQVLRTSSPAFAAAKRQGLQRLVVARRSKPF